MTINTPSFIIALDGPAASGKGTLARLIAEHYHFPHLDTGLTYRAVAAFLLENNLSLTDEKNVLSAGQTLDMTSFDAQFLAQDFIGEAASQIATFASLRAILIEKQRDFTKKHPECVLDGRDVGTVICPQADIKFFVTASLEERAKRRYQQEQETGQGRTYQDIFDALKNRDFRDINRRHSPLKPSENAYLLDTTKKSIKEALNEAIIQIDQCRAKK